MLVCAKTIPPVADCLPPTPSVPLDCRRIREERSMPVTARLSQKFYERFGDDIANELVNWFNQVDATYRTELKELNDTNFARLDLKLEQRMGDLRAELVALRVEMLAGQARLEGGLLARIGMAEGRLARLTLGLWVATLATIVALLKL